MRPRLVTGADFRKSLEALWDRGMPAGASTGWPSLDAHYTVAPGQMTIVTGWPSSGKSEWLDAMLVQLSRRGWQFAMFSFENQPTEIHGAKLAEKIAGLPFGAGPRDRIPKSSLAGLATDITQSFGMFHSPGAEGVTVPEILDAATDWFNAYAQEKAGLVIDPWNEIEHCRPQNLTETEYVSQTLSMVRNWARESKVHVWIVAHPRNVRREEGKLPVPRPDMISGSQHWWNKADCAISVWRDMEDLNNPNIEIHVQKVRFKHIGKPGLVQFNYDRVTGRYSEAEPQWVGASMRVP